MKLGKGGNGPCRFVGAVDVWGVLALYRVVRRANQCYEAIGLATA